MFHGQFAVKERSLRNDLFHNNGNEDNGRAGCGQHPAHGESLPQALEAAVTQVIETDTIPMGGI